MVTKVASFTLYLALGFVLYFNGKQIRFFFDKNTSYYSNYKSLPSPWKEYIQEYKDSADFYKTDITKLETLNFVILKDSQLSFSGYYDVITNTIFLNQYPAQFDVANKKSLWHELGHGVLNYGHDLNENSIHIMKPVITLTRENLWEEEKRIYFLKKSERNYIKNIAYNIFKMNWYFDEAKKITYSTLNINE